METKSLFLLALSAVLVHMAYGQCGPVATCSGPCHLGLTYPRRCGICVCEEECPICPSRCYYERNPGMCPACAPVHHCYK
uniref:Metastriate insulin growth factor binding protein n=1 Tax=Rhipicephalus appendiculatus TaxID=34631 RepID=A0A131YEK4_RHIAP